MARMTFDVESPARVILDRCHGDLEIAGGEHVQIEVEGDRTLAGRIKASGSELHISGYKGDLRLQVGADAAIIARRISGDVSIADVAHIELQSVGGDLQGSGLGAVAVDEIGGDVTVELDGGNVRIGRVGGDLQVQNAGSTHIGSVGGDAELENVRELQALGRVGGDLRLEWSGALSGAVSGVVGGDAAIELADGAHFMLRAVVGGEITGSGPGAQHGNAAANQEEAGAGESGQPANWEVECDGGEFVATFGNGGEELHLVVGGDLELDGGHMTNSELNGGGRVDMPAGDFGIGEEMRRLARDLKVMGRELARDVAREARQATRSGGPGPRPRVHVQFNDKAFHFDAEQVERVTREAREAAASGIARAQEAVERALVNMAASTRAWAPQPPAPRGMPQPPRPPSAPGYTGQTVRIERESTPPAATRAPEEVQEEKLAILRMVSEGRLGVDEAEVMLRALEGRG